MDSGPRFLALDWETNGLRPDLVSPLPCVNYPVSVSLWAVTNDGAVEHLYSSRVSGATQFCAWASRHHAFTPEDLRSAPAFEEVVQAMIAVVREGDVLVCHNVDYDVGKVLAPMCRRLGVDGARLLSLPRVCTCKGEWASTLMNGKWLSMRELCACFGVNNGDEHSAGGDAKALADCLAAALTRQEHMPGHGLARELRAAGRTRRCEAELSRHPC